MEHLLKAPVLTFDKNQTLADHMMFRFDQLWPDHPFTFLVPFQTVRGIIRSRSFEYAVSPTPIVETVLTVLEGIPDEEWIFWCMDDHFPLKLEVDWLERIIAKIMTPTFSRIHGVNFCASYKRKRYWRNTLIRRGQCVKIDGEVFVELMDYNQIWLPQFIRAGALRYFFLNMPEPTTGAKEMDALKDQIVKPSDHVLLLTGSDHAVFAESTVTGRYTTRYLKSARDLNFGIDEARLERGVAQIGTRGKLGLGDRFEKLFKRK
jgi:hypothetical protein